MCLVYDYMTWDFDGASLQKQTILFIEEKARDLHVAQSCV
jgi:hypothetical protein